MTVLIWKSARVYSEVKKIVDYITTHKGGEGAVREICELLLKAQDTWATVTEKYYKT